MQPINHILILTQPCPALAVVVAKVMWSESGRRALRWRGAVVMGYIAAANEEDVADTDGTALGDGTDVNSLGETAGAEGGKSNLMAG